MIPADRETNGKLNTLFRDTKERPPEVGDLILVDDKVYQLKTPTGWFFVCDKDMSNPSDSYVLELLLGGDVLIAGPPKHLIAVLLDTNRGAKSEDLAERIFGILEKSGWAGPTMTRPEPVPGTVAVSSDDNTNEYPVADIRPVLNQLILPGEYLFFAEEASAYLDKGQFHLIDLRSKHVRIIPDEVSATDFDLRALNAEDAR